MRRNWLIYVARQIAGCALLGAVGGVIYAAGWIASERAR